MAGVPVFGRRVMSHNLGRRIMSHRLWQGFDVSQSCQAYYVSQAVAGVGGTSLHGFDYEVLAK